MKLGDKVVIVSTPFRSEHLQPGQTGVVVAISEDIEEVRLFGIKMDNDWLGFLGYWNFYENELELVEET